MLWFNYEKLFIASRGDSATIIKLLQEKATTGINSKASRSHTNRRARGTTGRTCSTNNSRQWLRGKIPLTY